MPKTQKIIIIGFDGGTWKALRPMLGKGGLPVLKKIMDSGVSSTLLSTIPCRSGAAITTFYTGKNPCKWGLLDFPCYDPDVVRYEKVREKNKAVWDILGVAGKKSAILNMPATFPPTPTQGVMVSGFSVSEDYEYTYPVDFKKKIAGFHSEREAFLQMIRGTLRVGRSLEKSKELLEFYLKNVKKRYELIKSTIQDKAFDFSLFWIDETDAILHEGWGREEFTSLFFKEMDKILGDVAENNPEADIMIISDHGFDASPTHEFYPKSFLEKEGYLKLKGPWIQRFIIKGLNTLAVKSVYPFRYRYLERFFAIYNKIKNFRKAKPSDKNEIIPQNPNWRQAREGKIQSRAIGIDWQKTIATNHDFWGIKIIKENLTRDYEVVRNEIMEKMAKLTDKQGRKIIKNIWKKEEIFSGDDLRRFPDIVYLSTNPFEPTGFLPFCVTRKKSKKPSFPGDHLTSRDGIFAAAGPHIKALGDLGEINILDLAPTILKLFGVDKPQDMDGRVLEEIIKDL